MFRNSLQTRQASHQGDESNAALRETGRAIFFHQLLFVFA